MKKMYPYIRPKDFYPIDRPVNNVGISGIQKMKSQNLVQDVRDTIGSNKMKKKISCPKCGSTFGYYKHSTGEWICRKCPTKTKVHKGEVKNDR